VSCRHQFKKKQKYKNKGPKFVDYVLLENENHQVSSMN
jgi:hypothetical protein